MKAAFEQGRENSFDRFDGDSDIGSGRAAAAVVEAYDRTGGDGSQGPVADGLWGKFPIESDHGPHDSEQAEPLLHATVAEPADSKWGAHECWFDTESVTEGLLGTRKIVLNKGWRAEATERMGVAVITDFVTGRLDLARNSRQAPEVGATLKKRCDCAILPQRVE
jgi:hypothetical protein